MPLITHTLRCHIPLCYAGLGRHINETASFPAWSNTQDVQHEGCRICSSSRKSNFCLYGIFVSTELIHDGHSTVYQGMFSGHSSHDMRVVCKLASATLKTSSRRFQREAEVYQGQLSSLQGRTIPCFYGLYSDALDTRSEPMLCLLLEGCGMRIGEYDDLDLNIQQRYVRVESPTIIPLSTYLQPRIVKLVEALMGIHEYGVRYNDPSSSGRKWA